MIADLHHAARWIAWGVSLLWALQDAVALAPPDHTIGHGLIVLVGQNLIADLIIKVAPSPIGERSRPAKRR